MKKIFFAIIVFLTYSPFIVCVNTTDKYVIAIDKKDAKNFLIGFPAIATTYYLGAVIQKSFENKFLANKFMNLIGKTAGRGFPVASIVFWMFFLSKNKN